MNALRFPPRRILAGIDLSAVSLAAWRHAESWAERFECHLKAVCARGPQPLEIPAVPRLPGGIRALAQDLREEFRKRTGAPGLDVFEGDPEIVLLRVAKAWKADLLVVGTHGRTGMPRLLLGSVTEALLRESPIPVLAIRAEPARIKRLLVPVNFTAYADDALRYAASLAAALGAKLTVQHVNRAGEVPAEALARLEEELASLPEAVRTACSPQAVIAKGEPVEAISRAAADHDLVVLSGHRKALLHDLLRGTTAQQLVRAVKTPLLAVPARQGREGALSLKAHAAGPSRR
ncbi:MAG: universal stress protein [Elusimicrobia bacterium]|nr:universal stress protein [Elusimicrobiota bacterium]